MPSYNDLRPADDQGKREFALVFRDLSIDEKKRTITNLLRLRAALDQNVAPKMSDENLIIATWNIVRFGGLTKRLPESYFYIAEIVDRFDLLAIQEVQETLDDLGILMRLLGDHWAYMITDITEGTAGNSERFAYVYNTRRVKPTGLSGEVVLWDELTAGSQVKQLARTPHITGFEAGWKRFAIINIHLEPGSSEAQKALRKEEARLLLAAIEHKKDRGRPWTDRLMIVGDTNIYSGDGNIVQLFNDAGFSEVEDLAGKKTNASQTEVYDRIFFHATEYFVLNEPGSGHTGDVFQVFDHVYRPEDMPAYRQAMRDHKTDPDTLVDDAAYQSYFERYWRRNQISDHYPVWFQLRIDSSDEFLQERLESFSGSSG